jgi:catechol 2,3-dioxygenase-like lactoylglutathione lyase family enzyme
VTWLKAITAFHVTTAAPERLAQFYIEGLGFELVGHSVIPASELELLGLAGSGTRVTLRLGSEILALDSFEPRGRAYPEGATAADLLFQHFAIVTSDAGAAWERAQARGAVRISIDGPVTLPQSSGGVTAVKFRDPEGHPLELLQFPQAPARWHGIGTLGIDHTAVSVADAGVSRRFYEALGLSLHGSTLNQGPAQTALDRLAAVRVEVLPMRPAHTTPHLELLCYRTPRRVVWSSDHDVFFHDPDGHMHQLRSSPLR